MEIRHSGILAKYKWYRKYKKGHWEEWWFRDPAFCFYWIKVDKCSKETHYKPSLGEFFLKCEDY